MGLRKAAHFQAAVKTSVGGLAVHAGEGTGSAVLSPFKMLSAYVAGQVLMIM